MQLLMVSHKGLASGMLSAAQFVAGDVVKADVLEMDDAGLADYQTRLAQVLNSYTQSEPVTLLSDIPAGSAGSAAYAALQSGGFNVTYVSGINLAFLLEFVLSGDLEQAVQAGKQALAIVSDTGNDGVDDEDF
ncbi:PTS sugar transporter subunit IIA domain-containing protein [Lacticaseibacillus pantheris]